MTNDEICGAECTDDSKCQRPAGWGTDSDIGPCITHDHTADVDTGGRPSKFPDAKDDLLDAADSPKNLRQVANAGGIDESNLYRWLDDREEFCKSFKRARSRAAERLIQRALDPDDDIDRAFVRFLLERSFKFIKTERYEHRVDEDADLTDSEYNFLYE